LPNQAWEVKFEDLKLKKEIAHGQFGKGEIPFPLSFLSNVDFVRNTTVFRGTYFDTPVAIKVRLKYNFVTVAKLLSIQELNKMTEGLSPEQTLVRN